MGGLLESLGVDGSTNTNSDTGLEADGVGKGSNSLVVDLGLGERVGIKSVLGTDLETDTLGGSSLGVPGGLGTDLSDGVDSVVVGSGENGQRVGGQDGGGVDGGGVTNGSGVLGHLGVRDVVANLGTGNETIVAKSGIGGDGGALEEIKESSSLERGLLEEERELSVLGTGRGDERSGELTLKTLSKSLVDLNLGVENVGGGPALGDGDTVGLVGVLGLEVTGDGAVLLGRLTLGDKGDTVGGLGLDLEGGSSKVVVVLGEEVVGCLGNVRESKRGHWVSKGRCFGRCFG